MNERKSGNFEELFESLDKSDREPIEEAADKRKVKIGATSDGASIRDAETDELITTVKAPASSLEYFISKWLLKNKAVDVDDTYTPNVVSAKEVGVEEAAVEEGGYAEYEEDRDLAKAGKKAAEDAAKKKCGKEDCKCEGDCKCEEGCGDKHKKAKKVLESEGLDVEALIAQYHLINQEVNYDNLDEIDKQLMDGLNSLLSDLIETNGGTLDSEEEVQLPEEQPMEEEPRM